MIYFPHIWDILCRGWWTSHHLLKLFHAGSWISVNKSFFVGQYILPLIAKTSKTSMFWPAGSSRIFARHLFPTCRNAVSCIEVSDLPWPILDTLRTNRCLHGCFPFIANDSWTAGHRSGPRRLKLDHQAWLLADHHTLEIGEPKLRILVSPTHAFKSLRD